MKLSKRADYALKAVAYISSLPEGALASIGEIAESQAAPREFLAKVLKRLTSKKVLRSYQGIKGGYQLRKDPAEISYLDVIEAVDGELVFSDGVPSKNGKRNSPVQIQLSSFWEGMRNQCRRSLSEERFDKYKEK